MKKLTNSFKITFIRRPGLPPKTNEDQVSPTKHHIEPQQEQVLDKQTDDTVSINQVFHDQQRLSPLRLSRKISSNESNSASNVNTCSTDVSSPVKPLSSSPPFEPAHTNLKEIPCKTNSWSTRKKSLFCISAILLLAVLTAVAIALGILLTRQTVTTTTISTTTVYSRLVSASWSFDNTTTDLYNVYNGQFINGAGYPVNTTGAPFVGSPTALSLTSALNQSFLVASPFFDLTLTSFTIEAWIYPTLLYTGDRGIFSQCYCSSCINQCLYVILRGNRLYAGFTLNDITSSLVLTMNTWYHIAFVYNYQTQQQILYINGVQDTIKSNAQSYQGSNATIQIGVAQVSLTTNYFNGYIDNVNIVTRAKSSAEILNDATLVAYYSFDLPYIGSDNGPNGLNGSLVSTVTVNGRINQAIRFTGTSSYFQVNGFYRFGYTTLFNRAFSFSMWINPSSMVTSTLIQMSTLQLAGTCTNMLGLYATGLNGQIVAQSYTVTWSATTLIGPFISINAWTHISWTFSPNDGYILYVNGILFGSTGTSTSSSNGGNQMVWIYFGGSMTCVSAFFSNVGYQGSLDEVYFHTRELTQAEVTALANP